jgi:hypothetical protein
MSGQPQALTALTPMKEAAVATVIPTTRSGFSRKDKFAVPVGFRTRNVQPVANYTMPVNWVSAVRSSAHTHTSQLQLAVT